MSSKSAAAADAACRPRHSLQGHKASIEAVSNLLASKGQHASSPTCSTSRRASAARSEARGEVQARAWLEAVGALHVVAEHDAEVLRRAMAGHRPRRRAVAEHPRSLRALARLNLKRRPVARAGRAVAEAARHRAHHEASAHAAAWRRRTCRPTRPDRAIARDRGQPGPRSQRALGCRTLLADLYRKARLSETVTAT